MSHYTHYNISFAELATTIGEVQWDVEFDNNGVRSRFTSCAVSDVMQAGAAINAMFVGTKLFILCRGSDGVTTSSDYDNYRDTRNAYSDSGRVCNHAIGLCVIRKTLAQYDVVEL